MIVKGVERLYGSALNNIAFLKYVLLTYFTMSNNIIIPLHVGIRL
jgi:hypothetical protein